MASDASEGAPLVRAEPSAGSRAAQLRAQAFQGLAGLAALATVAALRPGEPRAVLAALGPDGPAVLGTIVVFSAALSLLKFRLTEEVFVSPPVLVFVASIPLLGTVAAAGSAVAVSLGARALALAGIGPVHIDSTDPPLQRLRLFGLVGTYGVPMIAGGLAWESLGGAVPVADASLATAGRIAAVLLVFQLANVAVLAPAQGALGYSWRTRVELGFVDTAIYLCGLPFAVLLVWTWIALGLRGLTVTLLLGLLGTLLVRDLATARTANRRLVERLELLNAGLEETIAARTAELRESNLRLMAADRAKSRFLANMSHELRTPLNSILGFSGILRTRARERLSAQFAGFLDNIHASGTHLLALINDILDLSKVEAGKLRLEVESFDVRQAVGTVERVIRGIASDSSVELAVAVDERLHDVRLDQGRFQQILLNLLSNAVKHSPRGGTVTLRVELHEARLSPLACPSLGVVVIDAGPGIAEAELERIFEEFYQVAEGRSRPGLGTGLGLPLTRQLVELHRGTIRVESTPGRGATFRVELPIDAADRKTPTES